MFRSPVSTGLFRGSVRRSVSTRWTFAWACIALVSFVTTAAAQLPQTRLYAISPPGARTGTEIELRILAGDDLEEVNQLAFSHPGITAFPKTTEKDGQQVPIPNVFLVKVDPSVPSGIYECRAGGLWGFSNPRRFVVGTLTEKTEETDNGDPVKAKPLELDTVVNGQMEAGTDLDWFQFSGTKGQRIVFDVWAERIDSKLNAVLSIYDSEGRRRLATSRNVKGDDPVLVFEVPADGQYLLLLHDMTYKNGNEYVYRLLTSTRPYLEYSLPPAGQAGTTSEFTLFGYNLPGGEPADTELRGVSLEKLSLFIAVPPNADTLTPDNRIAASSAGTDAFSFRLNHNGVDSNPLLIGIAESPVVVEQEPNNEGGQAQTITVPTEVGAQFSTVEDVDNFRFEAEAGQMISIDVVAERLGRATDPILYVYQVKKKDDGTEDLRQLTVQDDNTTQFQQNVFETKTDDPSFQLDIPETGTYQVTLRDRYWESRGHASLLYRLNLRRRTPDFRLAVTPSAPTAGQTWPTGLRQGDNFPMTVYAFRRDGFEGSITVSAQNLPQGIQCPEVVIPEKANSATLVATAAQDASPGLYAFRVQGTATTMNPEAVKAVVNKQKAIDDGSKPVADLQKAVDQAKQALDKAQAEHDAAAKAAADAPDNKGLTDQAAQSKQALDQAAAKYQEAQQKLDAQKQTIANLTNELELARQAETSSKRTLTRQARAATVVWSFAGNQPAIVRLADRVAVTVMAEPAPFQIVTDVHRIEANQSRQILIPVKLEKREFDEKVALNVQDMPKNSNIDFPNSAIEKGQAENVLRMFVKDNAPPGTYTLWLKSQGQVAYRRNPAKAERLKKVHEEKKAIADAAKATQTEATNKKNEAVNALNQANQMAQQAQATLTQKQQAMATAKQQVEQATKEAAQATEKLAAEEKTLATATKDKADAEAKHKTAAEQLAAAEAKVQASQKAVEEAKAAVAAAEQSAKQAEEAATAQPENEDLKKAAADAQTAVTNAQQKQQEADAALAELTKTRDAMKTATDQAKAELDKAVTSLADAQKAKDAAVQAKQTADQKQAAQQKALSEAEAAIKAAEQDLAKKQADAKVAEQAKVAAEAAEKEAQAVATNAENVRKAAETEATNAEKAAAPKNINFTPPSTPIVVVVKPAPVKLAATVPDGGNLKQGGQLQVKVQATRQLGSTGPVKLTLPLPPGTTGLTADTPEIPSDQTEGTITITAAADAPEGAVNNLVIRGTMQHDGEAQVDIPVTVKVVK
ncbi:MAG: hypothetical protein KDA80_19250 [Planctomycetaceae bacterium]|nr:hypothetical protein [Planctomycetaceae bacterium]